ncbi:MAG: translation initiation factor IF-3 [Alphaproteobacteria bacterium]|nr:translation initiation factor IF-3 [Alphaproteobacteria bacterium]
MRLIGADGSNIGVITTREALRMARDAGMDLVEISPGVVPPVCKILDFGKFKYESQKRKNEARKKQKTIDIKELQLSPNTQEHDFQVRIRSAKRFLEDGDKVKFIIRFRGRDIAYQNRGVAIMERICELLKDLAKVEVAPKAEGRQMMMIITPIPSAGGPKQAPDGK